MLFRFTVIRAAFLGVLFLFSCAAQTPFHPAITPENKHLTDPRIIHGTLANGFQYILKKNTTPKDRVSIHLNVFAGSMHETDEQQGVAHFLEHMLFNGSEHYEPGELARYFPSIGMDFGADANAHTSFFNTVYDLALPSGSLKQMDEAFVIIQDYAKGALILESEVERERGIILAEKRERDSVSYRTFKKTLGFELPDSRFVKRFPIGTEEVIKSADRELLKEFYDQWYRPENLALVVVGDFDIEVVKEMISQRFSKLRSRAEFQSRPLNTHWPPHENIKAFYHYEPEAGSTDVTIETITWEPFKARTLDKIKENTLVRITTLMLQNRLSRMVTKQSADFSEASVFSGSFLHNVSISAISATCVPGKWQQGLEQIEGTLRQGLVYGFEEKELNRVKSDYISMLERAADQAETQKTPDVAKRILSTINQKGVLLSAQQRKDLLTNYIQAITLEEANKTLKRVWAQEHRLVLVTGNAEIKNANPEKIILDVYRKAQGKTAERYNSFQSKIFPYLDQPGSRAGIKKRLDNINGLDITSVEFDNNVRLNVKKTDFKQNEVLYKVSFGAGRLSEPISKPGLSIIAKSVINESGLGEMDADQLEEALAGKKVGLSFGIRDNYFMLSGSADPKEMHIALELIRHYFNDPGYRPETLDLAKTKYKQRYDSMMRTPQGAMKIEGDRFLAKNDPRLGLPHPDVVNAYTLEDIKSWLSFQFDQAPVEISVIGDIDVENIISMTSRYISDFKGRASYPLEIKPSGQIKFPFGENLEIELDTKIDTGVVHVAFLTDDFWNIRQTRRLSIFVRVFSERLRLLIREELGETYSPYVYNNPSTMFEGYGVMHIVVKVNPERHGLVYSKIREIIDSIIHEGISEKEASLALKPVITHLQTLRSANNYWLNAVMANSSQYPEKFEWAKTMLGDYMAIRADDLMGIAQRYLKVEKSARILIKSKVRDE